MKGKWSKKKWAAEMAKLEEDLKNEKRPHIRRDKREMINFIKRRADLR